MNQTIYDIQTKNVPVWPELAPLSLNSISKLTELKFESNGIKSKLKRTVNLILLCVNNKLLSINKYSIKNSDL